VQPSYATGRSPITIFIAAAPPRINRTSTMLPTLSGPGACGTFDELRAAVRERENGNIGFGHEHSPGRPWWGYGVGPCPLLLAKWLISARPRAGRDRSI